MVKLTAELIEQAAQYTNAVRDRELDLRGESGERAGRPRASPPRRRVCRGLELGPRVPAGWAPKRAAAPGPPRPESCRRYRMTIP